MPVHEFGIIEDIYNSKIGRVKYNCISVNDEIIDTIYERLLIVKKPIFTHLTARSLDWLIAASRSFRQNHYHYSMMWLFHLTCMKTPLNFMN